MVWAKYQIVLAFLMVVSGSVNTVSIKWMDKTKSMGLHKVHLFTHPLFQTDLMFTGKILCLVVFVIAFLIFKCRRDGSVEGHWLTKGSRAYNRLVLLPAAMMNLVALICMLDGLTLTNASSFQMLRASVIVFTAILSKVFLKRVTGKRGWVGIGIIILGLVLVGLSDVSSSTNEKTVVGHALDNNSPKEIAFNKNVHTALDDTLPDSGDMLMGDLLIVIAQVFSACQMVYEENYAIEMDISALEVVGWEGIFGFLVLTLYLLFYGVIQHDMSKTPLESITQIGNSPILIAAAILVIISIAIFNFTGITITKEMSATTRMVIDTVRTLAVWVFSLAFGWQIFHFLQVGLAIMLLQLKIIFSFLSQLIGFVVMIIGICLYHNIIIMETIQFCKTGKWPTKAQDKVKTEEPQKD